MKLIEHLCPLAQRAIANGLSNFYTSSMVSTQLLPINQLTSQVQSLKNVFTANLADDFILMIDIMSMVVQNNQLLSAHFTNDELFVHSSDTMKVSSRPVHYGNCSCNSFDQSSCMRTTIFIPDSVDQSNLTEEPIFGIMAGCYDIGSLRKSQMAVLFNQTAIDIILTMFVSDGSGLNGDAATINALNASELGPNHLINTSIGDLLADLFVEEWRLEVIFNEYYDVCAPESCSYQITQYRNFIYIANFILGLIGGLATVLRLFVLPLVKFLRRKHKPPRLVPGKIYHIFLI